jgi:hypothetical protein
VYFSARPSSQYPIHGRIIYRVLAIAALVACSGAAALSDDTVDARRACEHQHAVRIGNAGKDVIWVPTHDKLVSAMLSAAGAGPDDFVIDLGAGDGKIPIAAARDFGAKALGIEYDPQMVELAQCYVRAEQLADKVEIRQADIFEEDFSKATVLTMYLLPELNNKLRPSLLQLRPGTRIVSNRFKMGRWQPDELISVEGVANEAHLWIVPAPIAGVWRFEQQSGTESFRARLQQEFQIVRGNLLGRSQAKIRGKVRGTQIQLLVPLRRTRHFQGELENDRIVLRSKDSEAPDIFIGRRD